MKAARDGKVNFARDAVVLQQLQDDARGPSYQVKVGAILAGVLEQAQALLNAIKLCTRLFDTQLRVPLTAGSWLGDGRLAAFDTEALGNECELGLAPMVNAGTTLACPLQLGGLGLDALRALGGPPPYF